MSDIDRKVDLLLAIKGSGTDAGNDRGGSIPSPRHKRKMKKRIRMKKGIGMPLIGIGALIVSAVIVGASLLSFFGIVTFDEDVETLFTFNEEPMEEYTYNWDLTGVTGGNSYTKKINLTLNPNSQKDYIMRWNVTDDEESGFDLGVYTDEDCENEIINFPISAGETRSFYFNATFDPMTPSGNYVGQFELEYVTN